MPTKVSAGELLTVRECAKELGVIPRRVQQFIEEDRINASMIGGRWFVTRVELNRFKAIERKPGNLTGRPRTPPSPSDPA